MVSPTIKKRAAKAAIGKMSARKSKRPIATHLDEENYKALKRLCAEREWTISDVLDALIEGFLEEIQKEP